MTRNITVSPFTILTIRLTLVLVNKGQYLLFPIGREDSFGLIVSSQPVNTALDQNQTEFSILILKIKVDRIQENYSKQLNIFTTQKCIDTVHFNENRYPMPCNRITSSGPCGSMSP